MKDIFINIKNKTRQVAISNEVLGIIGENCQGNFVIDFAGDFIDGVGWLETQCGDQKGYIVLTKDSTNKTYSLPIKSCLLTKAGEVKFQIRITQNKVADEIPIFKSDIFKMLVLDSINAVNEIPEEYPEWVDIVTAEIDEIDAKVDALDETVSGFQSQITANAEAISTEETARKSADETLQANIDKKVDKVTGKGLSTNDFTNDYKAQVDNNTSARHTHSNKELLDTYDQTNANIKDAVTKKHSHSNKTILDNTTASYTAEEKTKLAGLENYDDTDIQADITALQNGKVDKVTGKDLSTNDFTNDYKTQVDNNTTARHSHSNKTLLDTYTQTETNLADAVAKKHSHSNKSVLDGTTASYTTDEKTKLSGIRAGAEKNVQSDWEQTDTTADDYIKNKPVIPDGAKLYSTTGSNTDGAMTQKATTDALAEKIDKSGGTFTGDVVVPKITLSTESTKGLSFSDNAGNRAGLRFGQSISNEEELILGEARYGTNIQGKYINFNPANGAGAVKISGSRVLTANDILNSIYPIGSIYMSVNNTNPATIFGGTWEQIKDTFLLACGNTYSNGATGGEASHTLTVDEMPSHTHTQNSHNHSQNSHDHGVGITTAAVSATWKSDYNAFPIYRSGYSTQRRSDGTTASNNETTATNQNTGGGSAHNNMPPYLAVYMWKRTA